MKEIHIKIMAGNQGVYVELNSPPSSTSTGDEILSAKNLVKLLETFLDTHGAEKLALTE